VNSLSDAAGIYLENPLRLADTACVFNGTRRRPLFFHPRSAILCDGALSGAFHPNVSRHEDMIITTDFTCGGPCRCRPASRLRSARSARPEQADSSGALSWWPRRLPEPEPEPDRSPRTSSPIPRRSRRSMHGCVGTPVAAPYCVARGAPARDNAEARVKLRRVR
jgi:hypothetical protein